MRQKIKGWNDDAISHLPAPIKGQKDHWDRERGGAGWVAGLGLRITERGTRAWIVGYRPAKGSNRTRYTLGHFPVLGLDAARAAAKQFLDRLKAGHDPVQAIEAERKVNALAARPAKLVSTVLDDFVERYAKTLRTADQIESAIERLVKPAIGDIEIYKIRRTDIAEMLDEIEDENGPVMADRVLAYVRKAFNWYATRDDDFNTPIVHGMARTKPKKRARKRVLEDQEIRDVWAALDDVTEPACYARFVRTIMFTTTRRTEAAKMQWAEIKNVDWTIPPERYKTDLELLVPLTPSALAAIGEKEKDSGPYVFSSTAGEKPFSGFSKAKLALDEKIAEIREREGREPMERWTLHDLRRTGKTLMQRAGVRPDISERVLGHVIGGVEGIYDRYEYAPEKRDALQKLSDYVEATLIDNIMHPPAGNVVTLTRSVAK